MLFSSTLSICKAAVLITSLVATLGNTQDIPTGNHPDWPRWCGKVYEAGYPAFNPGGQTVPPTPHPNAPLLHVQIKPRYSLYLSSETHGEIIVKASISQFHGVPWNTSTLNATGPDRSNWLVFTINLVDTDDVLISNKLIINSSTPITTQFSFPLSRLRKSPSLKPIVLVLYGAPEKGTPSFTATTQLYYLPEKSISNSTGFPGGSVTKIDNLHNTLFHRNAASSNKFVPLFPHGFFASYDNFLREPNATSLIQAYSDLGLNAMTPLTNYIDSAPEFTYMDKINLKVMYNLREIYKNSSLVEANVLSARNSDSLFAYWSIDEPDGWQDPFHYPRQAYSLIKSLDPYHPVAIVLNCQNYYFSEYTISTSDIIMTDVYPIGINSTYSKWGTECTPTLGDCGCDNCEGNIQDVSSRLDDFVRYENWLGLWEKPKMFNPQSFHGQDYWLRDPTTEESWAMDLLGVNHGAKGLISWLWPAGDRLGRAHGRLARVITRGEVVEFLVGRGMNMDEEREGPVKADVIVQEKGNGEAGNEVVDAAYWVQTFEGKVKKMLVSVVNGGYVDINAPVTISVPAGATVIEGVPWDNGGKSSGATSTEWKVEGGKLVASRLPAMGTFLVILGMMP
ncbi:hypothetical protein V8F20_006341 [Naviculisporaceae sp. PSN 640]